MKLGGYPLSRQDNIVIQELKDEILIYDLQKNKALCLNQTSAMIWQACDGTKSVTEISQTLSKKLKSKVSEDVVWLAVHQFKTDNLLDKSNELVTPLDGLNRREIVKRIGFASMVALPLIASVVAPTALRAQSNNCAGNTPFTCIPSMAFGGNSNQNVDGCPCVSGGNCIGSCQCGNPCTNAPGPNGCPDVGTCVTEQTQDDFGSCLGFCPPSPFNICVGGGGNTPFCIPGDTSNLNPDCCPCSNAEGCANCCNGGVCGPCIG